MIAILVFVITLGIIITLHELGHLIAAKAFGVYCREFAIGMGPKLFSKQGKETLYSLRALPIGGYVAMAGEPDEDDQMPADLPYERTLPGIHPLKRIVVYLAGIIMNIFLFVLAFTIFFNFVGIQQPENMTSVISYVAPDSPAQEAGLLEGDQIIEVHKENQIYPISSYADLFEVTQDNQDEIIYVVQRENQQIEAHLVPEYSEVDNRYLVGVSFEVPTKEVNLFESFVYSIEFLGTYSVLIFQALGGLIMGRGLDQLGGPIRIFQETSKVASFGLLPIIAWIGQLSLNVAIFNLLPIPALDGGRVLLTLAELVLGRPINKELENRLITMSFLLLLLFIGIIIVNDIVGLF